MKRIILAFIAIVALGFAVQGQENSLSISINKRQACANDTITFYDATILDNSINDNIIGRSWFFADTTISGIGNGEQVGVFRQFTKEVNPVELQVYVKAFDTIVTEYHDTILNLSRTDTIVGELNDTTYVDIYDTIFDDYTTTDILPIVDTLYGFDTVYIFYHDRLTFEGDSIVCMGDSIDLTISNSRYDANYAWYAAIDEYSFALAMGNRLVMPQITNRQNYYIKITNSIGCVVWDSTYTYMLENSLTTLPADGQICAGQPAYLIAGKADHYVWESYPVDTSIVDSTSYYSDTIEVWPTATTIYNVTAYGTNGCVYEKLFATIVVHPLPSAEVNVSPKFVDPDDPRVTFTDLSESADKSYWSFGNLENAIGQSVTHTFTDMTVDSVDITLRSSNDLGCTTDTSFRMPVQSFASFASNVFTPNRAENNTFKIPTVNDLDHFSIHIYNRQGLLVFSSEDPHFEWDGSHKDKPCPQGAYIYVCNYRRANTNDVAQMSGVVTLLR